MQQNAEQERDFWLRRAEYLEREAKIALVRWHDESAFKIFNDGGDIARDVAEQWRAIILGGK